MKTLLAGVLTIFSAAWFLDLNSTIFPPNSATLWTVSYTHLDVYKRQPLCATSTA